MFVCWFLLYYFEEKRQQRKKCARKKKKKRPKTRKHPFGCWCFLFPHVFFLRLCSSLFGFVYSNLSFCPLNINKTNQKKKHPHTPSPIKFSFPQHSLFSPSFLFMAISLVMTHIPPVITPFLTLFSRCLSKMSRPGYKESANKSRPDSNPGGEPFRVILYGRSGVSVELCFVFLFLWCWWQ